MEASSTTTHDASTTNQPTTDGISGPGLIIIIASAGGICLVFIVMMTLGLWLTHRHPERYGPRAGNPNHPNGPVQPRSRAQGISRAVLDTFTVTKWTRPTPTSPIPSASGSGTSDIESGAGKEGDAGEEHAVDEERGNGDQLELADYSKYHDPSESVINCSLSSAHGDTHVIDQRGLDSANGPQATPVADVPRIPIRRRPVPKLSDTSDVSELRLEEEIGETSSTNAEPASSDASESSAVHPRSVHFAEDSGVVVAGAEHGSGSTAPGVLSLSEVIADGGTEICSICVENFEDGDDIRVLPCQGAHRFHVACIDEWLLNVNGVCPLCRADFRKLLQNELENGDESPVGAQAEDGGEDRLQEHLHQDPPPRSASASLTEVENVRTAQDVPRTADMTDMEDTTHKVHLARLHAHWVRVRTRARAKREVRRSRVSIITGGGHVSNDARGTGASTIERPLPALRAEE